MNEVSTNIVVDIVTITIYIPDLFPADLPVAFGGQLFIQT